MTSTCEPNWKVASPTMGRFAGVLSTASAHVRQVGRTTGTWLLESAHDVNAPPAAKPVATISAVGTGSPCVGSHRGDATVGARGAAERMSSLVKLSLLLLSLRS